MAKETGLGAAIAIDDSASAAKTISNDITSWDIDTPRGVQEVSGIDLSGIERLLLRADVQMTVNGVFNDATDRAHDVFKTVPSTSVNRTVTLTVSGQVLAFEAVLSNYALAMSDAGELTWSASIMLADGATPTWA